MVIQPSLVLSPASGSLSCPRAQRETVASRRRKARADVQAVREKLRIGSLPRRRAGKARSACPQTAIPGVGRSLFFVDVLRIYKLAF
ncbi:MAG: hypothetical protein DME69_11450 [Verrucomicrobia bacterium]|nr:MAG: hypothetical protein DME69_11450 [Verrucomicrobiota bacterium]